MQAAVQIAKERSCDGLRAHVRGTSCLRGGCWPPTSEAFASLPGGASQIRAALMLCHSSTQVAGATSWRPHWASARFYSTGGRMSMPLSEYWYIIASRWLERDLSARTSCASKN
jgi:hypothetical protein